MPVRLSATEGDGLRLAMDTWWIQHLGAWLDE